MPMNGATFKTSLKAALQADGFTIPGDPSNWNDKFLTTLCNQIVAHIQANALVTVTVASVSGVTTGPGVSGPGAGTGTIT